MRMKRFLCFVISMVLILPIISISSKPIKVNAANDAVLSVNWSNIKSVGGQDKSGVACACYAWAYCNTIVDGYVHSWKEYDRSGGASGESNAYCMWNGANVVRPSTKSAAIQQIYNQINAGRPCAVFVKSSTTTEHWVTVVGYTGVSSVGSMSESNLLIIDPANTSSLSSPVNMSGKYTMQTYNGNYNLRLLTSGSVPPVNNSTPSKPTLKVDVGNSGSKTVFAWSSCENATHYDLRIYDSKDNLVYAIGNCDDAAKFDAKTMYTKTNFSYTLKAGKYYANVAAVNNNSGKATYSDNVSFTIAEAPVTIVKVTFVTATGNTSTYQTKTVTYGQKYGELPVPPKEPGRIFVGWTAANSNTLYTADTIVTNNKDHNLFAKYEYITYTVTFDGRGGTPSFSSKKIAYSSKYGELPTVKQTGYTFKGWYENLLFSNPINEDYPFMIDSDTTIYAKWIPNEYTVSFDGNGGDVSLNKITVTYDKEYGTLPIPIREGYSFKGWYTAVNGGEKISEESIVKITSNQKLYAQWTANFGIDKKEITLKNGEQYTIASNQSNLTYKSNNTDVAIVSKNGVITAVGEGDAIISVINEDADVVQLKVKVISIYNKKGDCNDDGEFTVADVVMLQKWLLGSGDLTNWQNADLCKDGVIDVFDLVMMKRKLINS